MRARQHWGECSVMAANREAIPSQLQTDRKHQNCAINDESRAKSGSHLLLQGKQRHQAPLKWARNSHCGAAAAAAVRKTGALCLKELQQRHFSGIRLVTITVLSRKSLEKTKQIQPCCLTYYTTNQLGTSPTIFSTPKTFREHLKIVSNTKNQRGAPKT